MWWASTIGTECILILLMYINPKVSIAQFYQPSLCDKRCHCPPGEGVVDCNRQDHLQGVPTNVPEGVTKLSIQRGIFPQPSILRPQNMTGLEKLEDLRIIYCNIHTIEPRTFMRMTKLRRLDLSHNLLHRLDAYTFSGLQLANLYLQVQRDGARPALELSDDVFTDLSAVQIDLRGNSLKSVNFNIFSKVRDLDRLILSDNQITHLDEGYEKHFDRSSRLLDLTGNPLECSCKLVWIALRITDWVTAVSGLNITCSHLVDPNAGKKRVFELRRLTADQLCPTSRIHHVEVDLLADPARAVLQCTATSIPRQPKRPYSGASPLIVPGLLTRSPPVVAWRYVEGGHLREVKRIPTEGPSSSAIVRPKDVTSTVRLNVSIGQKLQNYTCVALDDIIEAEQVTVSIRGHTKKKTLSNLVVKPVEKLIKEDNGVDDGTNKLEDSESVEQVDVLFQKRFTILHMSVAVVATFLITIIFLIGLRLLHSFCFKRYSRFRLSSSVSSINNLDHKAVYMRGKNYHDSATIPQRNLAYQKMNGLLSAPQTNGQIFSQPAYGPSEHPTPQQSQQQRVQQLAAQPSPLQYISSMENQFSMSPHLVQFSNMNTPFLPISAISDAQQSSGSGTDELQATMARLTSTPLLHPGALSPIVANESAVSLYPPGMRLGSHHLTYFPVSPGSPYSISGSHVYDIPRVSDGQLVVSNASSDVTHLGGLMNTSDHLTQTNDASVNREKQ